MITTDPMMIINKLNSNSLSKLKSVNVLHQFRLIGSCNVLLKDSKDSNDDGSGSDPSKKDHLFKLLQDLTQQSKTIEELPPKPKIKLAEPRKMQRQKREEEAEQKLKDAQNEEKQPLETRIENAAKNIAKTLGGDETKIESELLNSLLSFKPDRGPKNVEDILKGMKTESESPPPKTRSQYVRESLSDVGRKRLGGASSKKAAPWKSDVSYSLFGEQPLGIFSKDFPDHAKKGVTLNTWNKLVDREVKLSVTHPPKNYFDEVIQWTEQGKLWHFPIDNEQGLEKEKEVHFSEHIMLYDHLEPWCPPRGPIRHFMELVCIGLSKNPYYTVEEKREHIYYYREYFRQKNDLLRETGCGEIRDTPLTDEPDEVKTSEKSVES